MAKTLKICLIAGEASGDALGGKLMAALKIEAPDTKFSFIGLGSEDMEAQGLHSLFPMRELSIIGWIEILPHIPHLISRINQITCLIKTEKPDMVITIDAPEFTLRVAKKLQDLNIPLIHYVAPTVWAYKPKRAQKFAQIFDHLLLLLPFEKQHFDEANLPCTFVGHPALENTITGNGLAFRTKHSISEDTAILSIMPGSRSGEIKRLLPIFIDTAHLLARKYPKFHVVFSASKRFESHIKQATEKSNIPTTIISSPTDKADAYAAANVCLAKSGTGTFEPAMAALPMVVAYKVNPVSAWILRRMLKTRFVNLINIILGKEVIPELLQKDCNPPRLCKELQQLLNDEDIQEAQLKAVQGALSQLTLNESSSTIAAKSVLQQL